MPVKNSLPRNLSRLMACLVLCSVGLTAYAKPGVTASVNGVDISASLFDQVVKTNIDKGIKDTPEMRKTIKDELIAREVLAQEATRLGLDKVPQVQTELALLRQNFLVEMLLKEHLAKNPVTDAAISAEYDRQVKLLNSMKDLQQYKIDLIVVASETDARAVIASLKKGASFEKLAREKSIDPSAKAGGSLNWFLPNQILPVISKEVVSLDKGEVAKAPVQTPSGWDIVKVVDKRAYKIPALEESKNLVRAGLEQQQRVEYARQLREAAKVTE